MAFNGVPWAITGSQLDTFVMREFANISTRDSEGIHLPGGGKVTALGSPSGNVNIAAGGILLRSFQAPGQSYVGRITSDTVLPIPATSGSSRSDLIIATIRDPDFSPWTAYTDPNQIKFGPYFYPERIVGTGSTVRASQVVSYTAYALARLDIPSGTTNITNSMIVDLRFLAQPRIGFAQALQYGPGTDDFLLLTDTSYRTWPTNTLSVTVPTWATHCLAEITLNSAMTTGNAYADTRINFGGLFGTSVPYDHNQPPSGVAGDDRSGVPHTIFADLDVRSLQGQTVVVKPEAKRAFTGIATNTLWVDSRQQVKFDLRFVERAV